MGLKALITIDLPSVTDDKRQKFYEKLEEEKWLKIDNLTTAWKASFNDDVDFNGAVSTLKNDIRKAKEYSEISKVNFALQVGNSKITIG